MTRAWSAWCGYWLAPGGRIAAAALRIAIAISLLWMLYRIGERAERTQSARYYDHGIWMLYPGRPGPQLISALTIIAWVSTVMMLVGLRTRLAHVVSVVASLAVATFEVSGIPTWTHQNVPPILASMALLGARTGDALAIDAWLARRRGRELPATCYQWSVRLVQLVVASVFFVAAVSKLQQGGLSLGWVLSDNLRHQLLMRFDWIHVERTAIADWLLGEAWRYRLFAGLNLLSQLSPIMAVFLIRRPRLRAALGAVWITEVLALGLVMALWDTHWLPLAAAFVDWDALAVWLRRSRPAGPPRPPARGRWQIAYLTTMLLFYAVQAFGLNQRLHVYPFSSYPMFSVVRAKRPFDVHQSYELIGGRIEVDAERPLTAEQQRWIERRINFRWMWQERRPAQVRTNLRAIHDELHRRYPELEIVRVRIWLIVDRAPAYPAPARLDRHDLAVLGELDADGSYRSALGTLAGDRSSIAVTGSGLDLANAELFAIEDDLPEATPLAARATPTGFTLAAPIAGDPVYVVARPPGSATRWLVAQHSGRGF